MRSLTGSEPDSLTQNMRHPGEESMPLINANAIRRLILS